MDRRPIFCKVVTATELQADHGQRKRHIAHVARPVIPSRRACRLWSRSSAATTNIARKPGPGTMRQWHIARRIYTVGHVKPAEEVKSKRKRSHERGVCHQVSQ
jgi:hypothetical protein